MTELAKAELRKMDAGFENEVDQDKWVVVQFNPETLKVSYTNQLKEPEGSGDQRGAQAQLFVGSGSTKLACQLWFDATAPAGTEPPVDDVRKMTTKVSYFIVPEKKDGKFLPSAVRFIWGSFLFDGVMDSLEESLEFFSPEGKPLRASISISLTQQKILVFPPVVPVKNLAPSPGALPLQSTQAGKALQQTAGKDWQKTAEKNKVENPRQPPLGRLR